MKYDYMITATGDKDRESVIDALLKQADVENVNIRYHMHFSSFLDTLPYAPIPGLAAAASDWLASWGNGGGDISTERRGISACTADNPRDLALDIYNEIAGFSLNPFEAGGLVMTLIEEIIDESQICDEGMICQQ